MDTKRLDRLESKIQRIKTEISSLDELRPGTLSRQYNVCGKPDCRCKASPPVKHGPYYQVSFTWQGKSTSQFVRQEDLPALQRQLRNYKRLRHLVEAWIESGMELSRLKLKRQRHEEKREPKSRILREKRPPNPLSDTR